VAAIHAGLSADASTGRTARLRAILDEKTFGWNLAFSAANTLKGETKAKIKFISFCVDKRMAEGAKGTVFNILGTPTI